MQNIQEFRETAGLVMDVNDVPDFITKAAFSLYTSAPNMPATVIQEAIKTANDHVAKTAYEMVAAAIAKDSGALIDYGSNKDVVEHAGLCKWASREKAASIGGLAMTVGKKALTTTTGTVALGTGLSVAPGLSEKKNQLETGGVTPPEPPEQPKPQSMLGGN